MTGTVGRYEAAIGADRAQWIPPGTWAWTDLSELTQDHAAVITRGRMSNQQSVSPATLPMILNNGDGALTPRHPGSPHYPNIARGLPIRHSVAVGDPYLLCDGSEEGASTPDTAALDITGDIAVAVTFEAPLRYRPVEASVELGLTGWDGMVIMAKWAQTQRSWMLATSARTGDLAFAWSTSGTAMTHLATQSVPKPATGPVTYAYELEVDNGIGGYSNRVYCWRGTIDDLLANLDAALVDEDAWTTTGTTSIFASTSPLLLGGSGFDALSSAPHGYYSGGIIEARVFDGDLATGSEVANPDFSAEAVGETSFSDAAGLTWTVEPGGDVTDYRPRFFGELAASYPAWPAGSSEGTAQVRWDAAGVLRRMRQNDKPLDSPMRRTVGAPANQPLVYAYWPLDDGSQATSGESPTPGIRPLVPGGAIRFGADDTCPGSGPAMVASEGQGFGWNALVPEQAVAPTSWRIELFAKLTPDAGPNYLNIWNFAGGSIRRVDLLVSTSNYQLDVRDQFSTVVDTTSVGWDSRFYGQWLYWSIKLEQNGADVDVDFNVVPLEGEGIQGFVFGTSDTWTGRTIGRVAGMGNLDTAPDGGISFANFIVADGALGLGWLANADTGWESETATQRIWRLCKEQGVTVYVDGPYAALTTGADEGVAQMGPQRQLPLLTLLEECAVADLGYLGESLVDDGLTYRTGATLINQEPALEISGEVTRDLAPADDDQGLINDLTVEQTQGSRYQLIDDESTAAAGRYEGKVTVNVHDADALAQQAGIRLALATWPEMRYPTIPLELSKTPALWPSWIAARPGDLLVAGDLPAEHPSPTIRQLLDGYVETITPERWRVVANTTPEGPWLAGVLDTDGTPDTDMRALDTDGSELDSSISDSDTSVDVAVTDGPLWTTDSAQYPLDLNIGGERVTATACAGASSPQTFTVTRGVDGVAVAHDAGTDVRLWAPLRLTI